MAVISAAKAHNRAVIAARVRAIRNSEIPADDPVIVEARQNLAALNLEDHVRKALAKAPKPTDEQLQRWRAFLDALASRSWTRAGSRRR